MKLEFDILNYLNENDNGKTIDITFIDDDYEMICEVLNRLKGRNLIVLDQNTFRDFEAFGISNSRKKMLKAKINNNGKIHLHALKNALDVPEKKKRSAWKLSYLFNF